MDTINIQNLINTKDRIQSAISSVEVKKKLIVDSLSVVAPGVNKEIQIKELELDKVKANLTKTFKETDLQIKYNLGVISEGEYILNTQLLSSQLTNEVNQIDANISKLQEQNTNKFSNIERIQKSNKKLALTNYQDSKKQIATATAQQVKSIATFSGKGAIIGVISLLVTIGLTRLSKEVGNLEIMVDNVNNVISNIQTKDDIARAKILRNNALRLLNSAEARLKILQRILKTITNVLKILNIALRILKLVALLPGAPKALLIVLIDLLDIIASMLIILTAAQNTINRLINEIEELKRKLKTIGDIIDNKLSDPNLDINKLDVFAITSGNYGKLGLLDGDYKGFRFVIKEENNPKYVIQGFKRRYATTINLDGNDVLIGEPSFTLDPDVLIEELKLIIDEQNLTP